MARKWMLVFVVAAIALMLPTAFVAAQDDTLDPAGNPNYAIVGIDPNFFELMDGSPAVIGIVSGGTVDASTADPACRGFVTSTPDLVLVWAGEAATLRLFFNSLGDTTLIVNQPDGTYVCSDDGDGLNPVIDINNPTEGEYAVWVGSFSNSALNPGYFFATTDTTVAPSTLGEPLLMASGTGGSVNPTVVTGGAASGTTGATGLSGSSTTSGPANNAPVALMPAGPVSLAAGAAPYATSVVAGGAVDVRSLNLTGADGSFCNGFAPDAPQVALTLSGTANPLRIFFVTPAIADSTMVVQLPNGTFYCNDDFPGGNLNPLVDIPNAGPGVYNIFVGTFSNTTTNPGVLYIAQSTNIDPITEAP